MDRLEAASLAFKIAGIYVMVAAVKLVPTIALPLREALRATRVSWVDIAVIGVPLVVSCTALAILAYVLIAHSHRLAERSLGEPRQREIDFRPTSDALQVMAFAIVGLVLLAEGIPRMIDLAAGAYASREVLAPYLRDNAVDCIVLFLQLSAGYWLFFGPRSAARVWSRLSGVRPAEPPPPAAP
ncbi:MAG: hypothetical protein H0V44_04815 [Planctomycetes bacterium]|nr:hypothetical protein [Planctomycetota bacterium]